MKISIVGSGYVGLVTGISLTTLGHKVICIENNKDKVFTINSAKSPFYEPGVDELLKKAIKQGLLQATDNLEESVLDSDITIIAVGTPTVDNKTDLTAIGAASEGIGKALVKTDKYHVITVKSTVLPGVTEKVVKPIIEQYSGKTSKQYGLCMSPEFLAEGTALNDALNPDRIVIGQFDEKSGREFAKIYKKTSSPVIFTNLWTAELTKYAANSLLATLISFSNEIARIAEATGKIDVLEVWKGVHLDKRLSPINGKTRISPGILKFILSGCGYGGSCFPKDTKALAAFADELGEEASLIKSVININNTQPQRTLKLLKDVLGKDLNGKKIAILGLTFKPETDDLRESPALPIINELLNEGAIVVGHDPRAYKEGIPDQLSKLNITLADSPEEALKAADGAIIVTSWKDYINLTPKFFKENMRLPVVIDARRIYDKNNFTNAGIIYKGIGL